jgi:hypothetical protein
VKGGALSWRPRTVAEMASLLPEAVVSGYSEQVFTLSRGEVSAKLRHEGLLLRTASATGQRQTCTPSAPCICAVASGGRLSARARRSR